MHGSHRSHEEHGNENERIDGFFAESIGMDLFAGPAFVEAPRVFDPRRIAHFGRFGEVHGPARRRELVESFTPHLEIGIIRMFTSVSLSEIVSRGQDNS